MGETLGVVFLRYERKRDALDNDLKEKGRGSAERKKRTNPPTRRGGGFFKTPGTTWRGKNFEEEAQKRNLPSFTKGDASTHTGDCYGRHHAEKRFITLAAEKTRGGGMAR